MLFHMYILGKGNSESYLGTTYFKDSDGKVVKGIEESVERVRCNCCSRMLVRKSL